MAQFRATIRGNRGEASRLGTKKSGLFVTANGWTAGIQVIAEHRNGHDEFTVSLTRGSSYRGGSKVLFTGTAEDIATKLETQP